MGLDLGSVFDSTASWLCSSRIVNRVISNPIFTALLITALAVVILMGVFHYCMKKAGWKRIARMSIYLLLVVSAVVFVHHYAVLHRMKADSLQQGVRSVFQSITDAQASGVDGGSNYPVLPPSGTTVGAGDVSQPAAYDGGGGDDDEDAPCPCEGAPATVGAAARPPVSSVSAARPSEPVAARADNVKLGDGEITISDVTIPSTRNPVI